MADNTLDPRKKPKLGPSDKSDTPSDRPGEPGTDTDSGGTGERVTVGKVPPPRDAGADRVVTSEEAGLGGGLDQAEEARLGKTDEEIAKERATRKK
jgi:hypothetical protein